MRSKMKYIFLNQKMNLTEKECKTWNEEFSKLSWKNIEIGIFPSYTNISCFNTQKYNLGAQNVSSYKKGSYTGEISAEQIKSLGVKYCLVGHSERRNYFQETESEIKEKIIRLQEENIIPVLCIGEKDKTKRKEVLKYQLTTILDNLDIKNLIVAYEPVYSIGTGQVLENEEIEEAIEFIKELLNGKYHQDFKVLYGGSVDAENIIHLKKISNVDGFLIGKASLSIENIKKIIEVM